MTETKTPARHQAELVLLIHGDGLDFERISQDLGLPCTESFRKGEVLTRVPPVTCERDVWKHEIQLSQPNSFDEAMNNMLNTLHSKSVIVNSYRQDCDLSLRLYVHSDYARIFYKLMPDTLSRLAATGLPLEVSVLSWGEY